MHSEDSESKPSLSIAQPQANPAGPRRNRLPAPIRQCLCARRRLFPKSLPLKVFGERQLISAMAHDREIDMYHSETAAVDRTAAYAAFAPLRSAGHDMPDGTLI